MLTTILRPLPLALLALLPMGTAPSGPADRVDSPFDPTHAAWTAVLTERVHGDRFDYPGLRKDRAPLDRYVAQLEAVKPAEFREWSRAERYAFWINAYNAYTVKLLLDNEPVDSIRDLGSVLAPVWKRSFIPLGKLAPRLEEDLLSLDQVEHSILRPEFEDARVHVAVNCASESCPPLRNEAFRGDRLEEQLEEQTRKFVADSVRNHLVPKSKQAEISKLFDWFASDFVRDAGSVREWLATYAEPDVATWLRKDEPKLAYLDYSWKLNVAR